MTVSRGDWAKAGTAKIRQVKNKMIDFMAAPLCLSGTVYDS
jgi:hypothetical protein